MQQSATDPSCPAANTDNGRREQIGKTVGVDTPAQPSAADEPADQRGGEPTNELGTSEFPSFVLGS